jgi:hypothetical protein
MPRDVLGYADLQFGCEMSFWLFDQRVPQRLPHEQKQCDTGSRFRNVWHSRSGPTMGELKLGQRR